jgi:hypothetical protein
MELFRQIVREQLFVSASVLCDFLDFVCGSLVLSARSGEGVNLHNVTLPRIWLMTPASFEIGGKRDIRLLPILIAPIGELLERIRSASDTGLPPLEFLIIVLIKKHTEHIVFDTWWREDVLMSRMYVETCSPMHSPNKLSFQLSSSVSR